LVAVADTPPALPRVAGVPLTSPPASQAGLPRVGRQGESASASPPAALLRPLSEQAADVERAAMGAALAACAGNRMAAARLLKMSRAAFYDKLARYGELAAIGRS